MAKKIVKRATIKRERSPMRMPELMLLKPQWRAYAFDRDTVRGPKTFKPISAHYDAMEYANDAAYTYASRLKFRKDQIEEYYRDSTMSQREYSIESGLVSVVRQGLPVAQGMITDVAPSTEIATGVTITLKDPMGHVTKIIIPADAIKAIKVGL